LVDFKVYLHPEDIPAKILLKYLRQLWKSTLEKVVFAVKKIVDPAAFCIVVAAEAANIGKEVRKSANIQLLCD
jgi:hypothetical protein